MAARAKAKADGVRTVEERRGAASERPRTAQKKQRSALLRFAIILHSENSPTKPKVSILVPGEPKV